MENSIFYVDGVVEDNQATVKGTGENPKNAVAGAAVDIGSIKTSLFVANFTSTGNEAYNYADSNGVIKNDAVAGT